MENLFPEQAIIHVFSEDVIPTDVTYHLFVARLGDFEVNLIRDIPLPEIEGLLPYVYEVTRQPQTIHEAEQEIRALKAEIVSLTEQLDRLEEENATNIVAELEPEEGDLLPWQIKRRSLRNARFTKKNQIFLLKAWLEVVQGARSEKPKTIVDEKTAEKYEAQITYLKREISNLRQETTLNPKEFKDHVRETKFLRRTLGEITASVILALESPQYPLPEHLMDQLQFNYERLVNLDAKIKVIIDQQ